MTELQTDPRLLEALNKSAKVRLSSERLRNQKVSFIVGSLDEKSSVTKEQVRKLLTEESGEVVAR